MRWLSPILLALALPILAGCGAVSSLSKAGKELDAYTLSPAAAAGTPAGGTRHLIVELPTSPGALATDRILIKPVPYQAQYLPDGRWTEPTPGLVQTLLVASFQNLGGFRLVGRTANGLNPDYTLMTDVQDFQAEPLAADPPQYLVRVSIMSTMIRESDRRVVASRRFTVTEIVSSDDTRTLVAAFDRTLQTVLREIVLWSAR
ncbi:MAG: ABC transporter [Acetobacteraceae bacterium]|nr:MAG: ABC transporter [Acetobacteraceae bacterium]